MLSDSRLERITGRGRLCVAHDRYRRTCPQLDGQERFIDAVRFGNLHTAETGMTGAIRRRCHVVSSSKKRKSRKDPSGVSRKKLTQHGRAAVVLVIIASALVAVTVTSVYGGLSTDGHFRIPVLVLVVDFVFLSLAIWSTVGWLRAMRGRK